ncbi:hypothetical protein EW026_g6225 [Hermanssonia centrifuga]|uniref:GED domain-containing protein n=1 Tax=Hermanssonia centrifuga TaxID=98765 RepID=A0A4S4KBM7_9APHY|nr:hypothetical protein EW026_g6225 [Hermanssonia centrifuga]
MVSQADQDTTVPTGDISSSDYAKRTRLLIKLITDLRALGAEADFDLPRIAVIELSGRSNQQDYGSSREWHLHKVDIYLVARSITQHVDVLSPRCPMECRLTYHPGPWQCQVLLRKDTDEYGNKITTKEETFGPPLSNESDLEDMLRRAQLAVLNPSVPSNFFVDFDTSSLKAGEKPPGSSKQLAFSNNVVCMDLHAPDVTDLSFIDLPGIISNVAKGEDPGNIEAVKSMVREHIKGNTLILLTITMRDDIDNQGAAFLAHEEDEKGLRTIGNTKLFTHNSFILIVDVGVLTKPDTIQHGEEQAWLRILEGKSHILHHGYFVTKQPSPKELEDKISYDVARQRETEFFENIHPWSGRSDLRKRMGTANLTKELSKLLGNVISHALPGIRTQAKESYHSVRQQLDALPPPPSENPAAELLRLVTEFSAEVEHLIQGPKVALIERFFKDWESHYLRCFAVVHEATLDELKQLVEHHFGRFTATPLLDHVNSIVEDQVEQCRARTIEKMQWMLELENPPFTNNDHYFSSNRDKYLARYKEVRAPTPALTDIAKVNEALAALAMVGYRGLKQEDLPKLRGTDEYDEELIVMAETSAYFHVSYKRIIDNIPRIIDHDFLRAIGKELQSSLITGLVLGTEQATDRASMYLAEDDQVAYERVYLTEKKKRLDGVLKKLYSFGV